MKNIKRIILIIIVILGLLDSSNISSATPNPAEKQISPGVGLRKMILNTSVRKLGFLPDSNFPEVYGVLTDWNIENHTATVMSMRDGTASLYTTSSFGVIGGQGHESVRKAAKRYVKLAEQYIDSSKAVTSFPYPEEDQVYFYILTYNGIRLCIGDLSDIYNNTDPTLPLFAAAQDVLTELRLLTEKDNMLND